MAECSYARCLQERRFIKRELLKWSKDMVQVIGLERFAEELMGRRKWKLFQEVLTRSQLNTNQNRTDQTNNFDPSEQTNIENLEPSIVENHHLTEKQEFTSTINKTEIKIDNLSLINDKTNNNKDIIEDNLINSNQTSPRTETKIGEKPIINPIDWKPSDKCYFCVDGKLLTVNEKGDLVAESGPALPEAELANRSTIDSDSDSRNSTPDTITNNHHTQLNTNKKLITSQTTRDSHPPNMTSFESMAAQIAAISKIQGLQSGLGQLYPSLWYHQLAQQLPMGTTTSESPSAAALSPSNKDSPSPSETTGEQPLDLSSKPSPVFRAKPRINTTVTGRRTYTEEELAMALQDILSGKLGTRRAAVIYGIPRSTLRNKVYKIALEQKREISSTSSHQPTLDALDVDDDDKDGSGDEDRDDKLLDSSLLAQQVDHLSRFETSHLTAAALQKLRKSNSVVNNEIDIVNKPSTSTDGQNKLLHSPSVNSTIASAAVAVTTPTPSQQSQTPPIAPNRWLDTNVLLQSLLLSGSLGGLPGLLQQQQPKMDDPAALQELFNSLLMHQEEIMKEQLKNSTENRDALNNGKSSNLIDPLLLMQNLPLLRQQQQQQLNQLHTPRLPKSETPDTASSVDLNETISDDGVILKIPSFKPVVPGSSASSKNGDSAISPSSVTGHGLSSILSHSPHHTNNMSGIISPTLMRQSSESQSPPILSLREVIANSISRTFSQQQKESNMSSKSSYNSHESSSNNDQNKKRASISVIKTIGGTDISQFASTPNLLNNYHHHHHHHHQNSMNAGGAAGKGTRPKRGKYRNYDRDSLVEAVKAVQRGEMSVHRAGSYYGVPHSTLEYKVKERHLMRPRKREPKPQPLDERTGGNNNSSTNSNITSSATKHSNIPGLTNAVNNIDKLKTQSSGGIAGSLQQSKSLSSSSTGLKNSNNNNPPFPSTSPNGMKVPIFDSAMAAQLQYAPHLFWPHTAANFGGLPIDFQRQAAAAAAAANAVGTTGQPGGFTQQNAESFLASQMIQRFHEESNRLNAAAAATAVSQTGNNNNNYQKSTNISPSLIATTNSCTTNTTTNTTNLNNNINTNNIINNNNTTNINNSCSGGSSSSSSSSGSNSNVPIAKSAREIAESLYDNGGANGSFLDGIIRQTLDRKTGNDIKPSQGALLDQLVKNTNKTSSSPSGGTIPLINNINEHHNQNQHIHQSLTNNNNNNNNSNNNNKRSGSPIQYPVIDIKRERSNSPLAQQQHHSHLSMALTPNDHHRNKRNSSIDGSKISDGDIESSEIDNDVTATSTTIKSNNDGSGSNSDGIMIKLEDNHQLHSLGRHHHHQLHQQLTSSNIRSIEDLNGGNSISGSSGSGGGGGGGGINNSILQEKLGHIKSETEDSL